MLKPLRLLLLRKALLYGRRRLLLCEDCLIMLLLGWRLLLLLLVELRRRTLLEVGVEHRHLLTLAFPVIWIEQQIYADLAALDLSRRGRLLVLGDPYTLLLVEAPQPAVPVRTGNKGQPRLLASCSNTQTYSSWAAISCSESLGEA